MSSSSSKLSRYDWRKRATSRTTGQMTTDEEKSRHKKRLRVAENDFGPHSPYYNRILHYSSRFRKLLDLEEAEDEAALKHRLSTWSLAKLKKEGYCLTDLKAYWLKETQFGRPVADFLAKDVGDRLPENKLERGTQVLISRLDPLKEEPVIGSVLDSTQSHIRILFQTTFDLQDELWRLDLGRPNLMWERMRTAINQLQDDPAKLEVMDCEPSTETILQGTHLRDVLLRSFSSQPVSSDAIGEMNAAVLGEIDANEDSWDSSLSESEEAEEEDERHHAGVFKDDQLIQSWAERYSRPNPVVVEGDPPLDGLNASQIQAMATMIRNRVSLVQGPPGTGKTKTIIETIKLLKSHFQVPQPILVCTYTNVAVDNLVEGFGKAGVKPLRIGQNATSKQSSLQWSLDYKLQEHPLNPKLLKVAEEDEAVSAELKTLSKKYEALEIRIRDTAAPRKSTLARAQNMRAAIFKMVAKKKILKKNIYGLQQLMLRDTVAAADVICTTCISSACYALNVIDFPVVFIDEASMSTEPASLIPLMKGSRHLALIGDHKQLPPIIVSREAKQGGLGISLFERLTEEKRVPSVMLDIQYRMHPLISKFPSLEFYDLALQDGTVDAVGNVLPGLEPPRSQHLIPHPSKKHSPSVIFLDHAGSESFKGRSRVNITEAHLAASVVEDLLLSNPLLTGADIGIIAPYAAQVALLTKIFNAEETYRNRFQQVLGAERAALIPHIEIKTVDGFEGREKEVIIFSTVRNNSAGHIGFLADKKRLNVGLTRAKRGLFVLGNISTLRAGWESTTTEEEGVRVSRGKGADSWRRYAEYLVKDDLVISLTGNKLQSALYGNWRAAAAAASAAGVREKKEEMLIVGR
ncbi:P-loop containing nucleoside triphosphate hydrolase protein [Agrocybe pediades]|nr:P-loop containing nucleoside triphosphate hydrolase protein [Agrocybe pediades]